jgi:predicted GNAT family N-acyltransferase
VADNQIKFKVANGRETQAALQVRAQVYVANFGHHADDDLDAPGYHLIGLDGAGDVVGGFRLLGPELRPFDFERVLGSDAVIQDGRRPAMLGRLFVRRDFRGATRSTHLLLGLLNFGIQFAAAHHITDFYMYTFSHLLRFYSHAGFRSLGVTMYHQHWRTLYLMQMDVKSAAADPETTLDSRP